ncbi:MAG: phosphatidylglycerophosphatase A [Pseudoprimorskyibacter sp.]|nr:phosphatidylglycerophosphatase A [Pseudoprimorskyibacter sp.]
MQPLFRMISTVAGVGLLRPAPGTWGSLIALPLALIIHWVGQLSFGGFAVLVVATGLVFVVGVIAIRGLDGAQDVPDRPEYVIDEVVGQWIALWPVSLGAVMTDSNVTALWPGWLAAFVLFRVFDIWKPSIIGRADRRGDAMGVMLDDVLAGVFAAIGVILLAVAAHVPVLL